MVRQRSHSRCEEGRTWGSDANGIWVDRGCRAEFQVREGRYRTDQDRDWDRNRDRDRDHDRDQDRDRDRDRDRDQDRDQQ